MKTYILRQVRTVESEKSAGPARRKPVAAATAAAILERPVAPLKGPVLFIGLDVHNDSIAVSLAPSDAVEVRRYGIIGGEHEDVVKLAKKLAEAHPGRLLKFCYEAGPRGFALCRCLQAHGRDCILVCPSKVPRKPGERVKTDRRDADDLARLYRAGELTGIYVPEPEDEAMRDLIRARFQVGKAQHRARHN
jgi:transposase